MTGAENALPADAPAAELVGHGVGAWPGDDDFCSWGERQGAVLVAQQGHRLLRRLQRLSPSRGDRFVCRIRIHTRSARVAGAGLVEKTELELQGEDPAHCLVDAG